MPNRRSVILPLAVAAVVLVLVIGVAAWLVHWVVATQPTETIVVPPATNVATNPTIGGIVQDESGLPIRSANVDFSWIQPVAHPVDPTASPISYQSGQAITGVDGRWSYSGVPRDSLIGLIASVDASEFAPCNLDALPVQHLLDQNLVTVLSRGGDVNGQVVDMTGQPVSGATVLGTTTGSTGKFVIHHMAYGPLMVYVLAKGFGPEAQRVQISEKPAHVRIALSPGKTLHVRIVDVAGKPIRGVRGYMLTWRNQRFIWNQFNVRTNADGRLQVPDAPDGPMTFVFSKTGFIPQIPYLTATASERIITMRTLPSVNGKVTDAVTHQPIPNFFVTGGAELPGTTRTYFGNRTRAFVGGQYVYPIRLYADAPRFRMLIEANGYQAIESLPFWGGGQLPDIALTPSSDLQGRVLSADGNPVAGLKVELARAPKGYLWIQRGRISSPDLPGKYATTDADGRFHFTRQLRQFDLWAISDAGCAMRRFPADFDGPLDLQLQPWASALIRTEPSRPQDSLQTGIWLPIAPDESWPDFFNYPVVSGDGNYLLDHLPVIGQGLISLGLTRAESKDRAAINESVVVRLKPGQTTQLDLTGGVTLSGRLVLKSAGDLRYATMNIALHRVSDLPVDQWPTDPVKAAELVPPAFLYRGLAEVDGTFRIAAVTPGRYEYAIFDDGIRSFHGSLSGSGELEIPADHGSTFDLGELPYVKAKTLSVGDAAPPILGRRLNGTPIRSSDFAGKFVVCIYWQSTETGETPADLSRQFASNQKVAFVGVNFNQVQVGWWTFTSTPLPRPAVLAGDAWTNGYLSLTDEPYFCSLLQAENSWEPIMIIGPDGHIAAVGLGYDQVSGKLAELLAK